MIKVIKAFNLLGGMQPGKANIRKRRLSVERLSRLAVPRKKVRIRSFSVGEIACERIRPGAGHDPDHSILYIHGGGFFSGGIVYARILAAKLALATGFTVYSFVYRLAPEHPYPAALEDSFALWDHLAKKGIESCKIWIAGDSAGGNLALCMVQDLIEKKRPVPAGLLLFSPWTDMTATAGSYEKNAKTDPILTRAYVKNASRAYIAGQGRADDRIFSPLFGSFEGFPAVYIMAGRNEILLDDSLRLKDRITAAGGRAVLDIEEKGWHVYQQMPLPIADRAMERLSKFVKSETRI